MPRSSLSFNERQLTAEKLGRPERVTVVRASLQKIDPLGDLSDDGGNLANTRLSRRVDGAVHVPLIALELNNAHEVGGKEK